MKGERPAHAALIGDADRIDDGGKSPDTRCDDGRGALARTRIFRLPSGLRDGFVRCHHGELDEAIHLLLIFFWDRAIDIEAEFGIIRDVRHDAAGFHRQVGGDIVREGADAGLPRNQP